MMRWDGTRRGIDAICEWANNNNGGADDEPPVMYEFIGADDVQGVTVATDDGDYTALHPGDLIRKTASGFAIERAARDDDRQRGLYRKYEVYRVREASDGHVIEKTLVTEPCFVLRYTTDPHAAVALAAYADSCEADYSPLATDLRKALRGQPECECDEPACMFCEIHGETGNRDDEDQDDTDWTHSTGNEPR